MAMLTPFQTCFFQIGWHQSEHTLSGLHCGREYNAYVVLVNALGLASPTSEVLNVRTQARTSDEFLGFSSPLSPLPVFSQILGTPCKI